MLARFTALAFSGVIALATPACSEPDRAIWLDKHDARMEGAIKAGKDSLPTFWRKIDSGDPAIEEAMVKVGYPTAHGGTEYLWMALESHSAEAVTGVLVNEPEDVPGVHEGQRATVELSRVADWAYFKGGKSFGQFTTRMLLDVADENQRAEIAESLAPTPLEPETK